MIIASKRERLINAPILSMEIPSNYRCGEVHEVSSSECKGLYSVHIYLGNRFPAHVFELFPVVPVDNKRRPFTKTCGGSARMRERLFLFPTVPEPDHHLFTGPTLQTGT
jgi:hypothetical protein